MKTKAELKKAGFKWAGNTTDESAKKEITRDYQQQGFDVAWSEGGSGVWGYYVRKSAKQNMITLFKGGTAEKTIPVECVVIPDLWHVAARADSKEDCEAIREVWHLAHELKKELIARGGVK